MKKESLMTFTDGVIAIIVTLMVLDIRLPNHDAARFTAMLLHIGIYAISFTIVAIFCQNLHAMLDSLECVTRLSVWLTLSELFFLSLVPLPTEALGEHPRALASHVFFGVTLTLAALVYAALHKSVEADLPVQSDEARRYLNRKNWLSTALFAVSPLLALLSTWLSLALFIIVPALYFLPSRHLSHPDE